MILQRIPKSAKVGALAAALAAAVVLGLAVPTGGQEKAKPSLPETMKRMKYYNQALGVECDYCHIPDGKGNFKFDVDTPRKKSAKWMQEKIVDTLVRREGSQPIDCHTCHDGRARFLPSSQ